MSMQTYITEGYGLDLDNKKISYYDFCKNHKETLKKILDKEEYENFKSNQKNFEDDYFDYGNFGVISLVQDIINEETGIEFYGCIGKYQTQNAILFLPTYPWYKKNEKEKKITTRKQIDEILEPYRKEFGVEEKIDYLACENYG